MSKIMQNLVILMEQSEEASDISFKAGKRILNRFCIDEDAAFELSGVIYFKKMSWEIELRKGLKFAVQRKLKGKEYSLLRSDFILRDLIFSNN